MSGDKKLYVLIYAPHGIIGEDGSKAILCDTHDGAHYEMFRQVRDFLSEYDLDRFDYEIESDHATADLRDSCGPEWHIYEV